MSPFGDIQNIKIGSGTNIQDGSVIHTSIGLHDCVIGDEVTVGHGAILHGCIVKNACIIGMGSVIFNDAVIGEECIIGAIL
jgi:carbonic anhydrase/acetyltransferase-like protein (isoleucine patch superfamily)